MQSWQAKKYTLYIYTCARPQLINLAKYETYYIYVNIITWPKLKEFWVEFEVSLCMTSMIHLEVDKTNGKGDGLVIETLKKTKQSKALTKKALGQDQSD